MENNIPCGVWTVAECIQRKTVETLQWWQWSDIKIFHVDPIPAILILSCWRHCHTCLGYSLVFQLPRSLWRILVIFASFWYWLLSLGLMNVTVEKGKNEYLAVLVSILRVRLGLPLRRGLVTEKLAKIAKHALKSVLAPTPLTWALPPMVKKKNFPPTN